MNYGFGEILTVLGSLALFLYGMKVMSDALTEVAGDKMRNILSSMTSNRVKGVCTGFLITSVIQSSSATTLMVVSFVNASLLTLAESVAVIMGANIGTTITAWLITILGFKVSMSAIALPLVALGFLFTFSKKIKNVHWGQFIIGFAVLFIGLQFLKDAVPDISKNPEMLQWLQQYTDLGFPSVLLFLLIGTLLTVIIQSSSATMALTLVMTYEGWIPFDMAAAMVLGENIGTTITANLAALVANTNAKRTARAHFLFNMLGVAWMLVFFYSFLYGVDYFLTREGSDSAFTNPQAVPVALSTFHTSFNIINTSILIWFVPTIVRIVERMIPYRIEAEPEVGKPKYLSDNVLKYPQTAISALVNESKRLFEGPVFQVIAHAMNLHREDIKSEIKAKKVVKSSQEVIEVDIDDVYYSRVKNIYSKIIEFGTLIQSNFTLDPKKMEEVNEIKLACRYMVEAIKYAAELEKNINRFMTVDNTYIQKEYNELRRKMTKVLREVYLLSIAERPQKHANKLEKIKLKSKSSDILTDGTLDKLIRKELITSEMAASLANDSSFVTDISKDVLEAAELLYIKSDTILEGLPKISRKELEKQVFQDL